MPPIPQDVEVVEGTYVRCISRAPQWIERSNIQVGNIYKIAYDCLPNIGLGLENPVPQPNFIFEREGFEILNPLTENEAAGLQPDTRIICLHLDPCGDDTYQELQDRRCSRYVSGQVYTVECINTFVHHNIFTREHPGESQAYQRFALEPSILPEITESIPVVSDIPEFHEGDIVYVRTMDDMEEYENQNWAINCHLRMNTAYTISAIHSTTEVEDTERDWVEIEGASESLNHPARFISEREYRSLTEIIEKAPKHMPQVIYNCDVGAPEKSIFEALAKYKGRDIYVYNMNGVYATPSTDISGAYHLYFYAGYMMNPSGTPTKVDNSKYGFDIGKDPVSLKIPILHADCEWKHTTLFINIDFLTPLSNEKDDILRVLALLDFMRNKFGMSGASFDGEFSSKLYALKALFSVDKLESQRLSNIESCLTSIREYEDMLIEKQKSLLAYQSIRYSKETVETDILDKIKLNNNVTSAQIEMYGGRFYIVVKTKPLISHLPFGDIPSGSMIIRIPWQSAEIQMIGEYQAESFHPHYRDNPCWGGFSPMITKLAAQNNHDILVELILKWFDTYDGSGVFAAWYTRLAQRDIGIIINESNYLSGEYDE